MKNKAKKTISIEAKRIHKWLMFILLKDQERISKLPGINFVDDHHIRPKSNEVIGYRISKVRGIKTDVYIYNIEEDDTDRLSLGFAIYNDCNTIALNINHLNGLFVRNDRKSLKNDQLRTIRHELGHLYEYRFHNDRSEKSAEQYE